MPYPSFGLLLAGRSHKQAGSPNIPVKDPLKHLKFSLVHSEILDSSVQRDATCNISGKRKAYYWHRYSQRDAYETTPTKAWSYKQPQER